PYTYTWSNGASGSSINVNPTTNTTYTVTAKDADNRTATDNVTVTVNPPAPVILTFSIEPRSGLKPLTVTFSATGTGTPYWSFGDGGHFSGWSGTYVYQNAGTFEASLTVTSGGSSVRQSAIITVTAPPPLVEITLLSNTRGIGVGDSTGSGNDENKLPAYWMSPPATLAGMTPYITVSCEAGQRWYLKIYRSADAEPELVWFTGPGEHQVCGPLPNNFLGLIIGVQTGGVKVHLLVVRGVVAPTARLMTNEKWVPKYLDPKPLN
ncbi:hypothetical protein GYA54_01365, partial [Candidatus Kuenenbacteria bacterium]|nr:hypothetical protein [Candidatus Kuenenbacteria bacterium]